MTLPPADTIAAIERAALDYIEGWYEADGEKMRRSLHPDLAKRKVRTIAATGRQFVEHMSATMLAEVAAAGGGRDVPPAERIKEVQVYDVFGTIATARVLSARYVDYLHLACSNGEWRIVNVLWELRPAS